MMKLDEKLYLPGFCRPDCPWFPIMDVQESDIIYNEEGTFKIRRSPKIFKCMWDNHPIDWSKCTKGEGDENF